jgi:glutathione S-transferase
MDSWKIAQALEARYPKPSLHLDSPIRQKIEALIGQAVGPLVPVFVELVPKRLLGEREQEYWARTRKPILEKGPDPQAWEKAAPALKEATELLKANGGPFFLGKEFSYADVMWIGLLIFWRRIGDDVFEKFLEATGDRSVHLAMLEAAKQWTERDDH